MCVFVILLLFFNYDYMFYLVYEYWGGGIEECCGSLKVCSKKYLRNGCRYFKPSSMNIIFFSSLLFLLLFLAGILEACS